MNMSYKYSTDYPDDDFPKLFKLLRDIIENKRKNQEDLEKFGSLPGRTPHESAIYDFISKSMIERKDLEILHDRLVSVYDQSFRS